MMDLSNPLFSGGTWLFDVVGDPFETTNLATSLPDVVADLMGRLQALNASQVPQEHSATDPASDPKHFGGVWTPWRGNPTPSTLVCLCDSLWHAMARGAALLLCHARPLGHTPPPT